MSDEKIDGINFDSKLDLYDALMDVAALSGTQENVICNLTNLRNAAISRGKNQIFYETFKRVKDIVDNEIEDFKSGSFVFRYRYTIDDFKNSIEPYEEVFRQPNAFLQKRAVECIAAEAKAVKFNGFKNVYQTYIASKRAINEHPAGTIGINPTDFPEQPIELEAGEWNCDFTGVSRTTTTCTEYACHHPIMPIERLVNIDTGEEKLKIAYSKGKYWREIVVGKNELFDSSKIIKLAAVGVSVTSTSARLLSEFICDIETMNYDVIPERESVSRLGFIGDGHNFSPYVDGLVFDGDANYSTIYSAISQKGSYEEWLKTAIKCRNESITAQIMLASSFASVLISKVGALSFFVHLWGIESGTGKTVALMLAASVWGNPNVGQYIQTFNATQVGHEKTAAFLNNLPMLIDELQLSKDSHGKSKFDVYQLSQGVGRTRGTKSGGIDKTPTWALCILTTGESPITSASSGAGAVNRVIDIECRACEAVIKDGMGVSSSVKQNYGYAGKDFINQLSDMPDEELKRIYSEYFKELSAGSTTEKQAMAAAMILVADELADKFIFHTGKHLTVEQISEFLKTKTSVSAGERGYAYMCDWVALNSNKFRNDNENGDVYGIIIDDVAYINSSVFRKAAKDAGFDDRALLSWLRTRGLIQTRGKAFTKNKRINRVATECVVMQLNSCEEDEEEYEELL